VQGSEFVGIKRFDYLWHTNLVPGQSHEVIELSELMAVCTVKE
jgi:hypothetical protein